LKKVQISMCSHPKIGNQPGARSWQRVRGCLLALLAAGMLLFSCESGQSLRRIDEATFARDSLAGHEATVVFFLSPECPLCKNYALTINQLHNEFENRDIVFYGVFPGTFYKESEIIAFLKEYKLVVVPLLDPEYMFTHALGARVTPEVFVFDATGLRVYQGAIDNWVPKLGQKRTVITRHYLADVLHAVTAGEMVAQSQVQAVGCLIE
jgi:thiol-disulfide isomerase/thioredoxin